MLPGASAGPVVPPRPVTYVPPPTVQVKTGEWISAGWNLVTSDTFFWVLTGLAVSIISGVVPLILLGPMLAGYQMMFARRLGGRKPEFGEIFLGFNYFVPTMVAGILISIFVGLGSIACLIPGLVLHAMYQFTYLFIIDKRMDFWPAMQASHDVVKRDYVGFTLFVLALIGINILGILCCLVGVLVTIPVTYAATVVAYRDVVGFEPGT